MNLLDFTFYTLFFLTLITVLALLTVAAGVAVPDGWQVKLQESAIQEIGRRPADPLGWTQADREAVGRMTAHAAAGSRADPGDVKDAILDAVSILTDCGNREQLDLELRQLREPLLQPALSRQVEVVSRVSSLRIASYLWVLHSCLNRVKFVRAGLFWLVPRMRPRAFRRWKKYAGIIGIVNLVVGILVAGFSRTATAGSMLDWQASIGNTVTVLSMLALVPPTLGVYWQYAVARLGIPRSWNRRWVVAVGVQFVILFGLFGAWASGALVSWLNKFDSWMQGTSAAYVDSGRLGAWVMAFLLGFGIWNGIRKLRPRGMKVSQRLWMIVVLAAVAIFWCADIVYILGLEHMVAGPGLVAAGWIILGLVALAGVWGCVEWVKMFRLVRRVSIPVPRRGFRWWALILWVAALPVLVAVEPLVGVSGRNGQALGVEIPTLAIVIVETCWLFGLLPGLVITALYMRRVVTAYRDYRFGFALPHPGAASRSVPACTSDS